MEIDIRTARFFILFVFEQCICLNFIDIPHTFDENNFKVEDDASIVLPETNVPVNNTFRRSYLQQRTVENLEKGYEDEKDINIKLKISTLVQQTIHDTQRKISSIDHIKEQHREEAPYKAGFILSMIKKSRDVLNELFNVAVKHKDEWKALEQLKIFELIVHTNVDTTNLVRQLVEVHIQHLNSTNSVGGAGKKRVVLLR